jgi:Quinohemoprotein amine dehydrogenase, gamma subunit
MRHLKAINRKARTIDQLNTPATPDVHDQPDVVALQGNSGPRVPDGPHVPLGCSFVFAPGWEVDSSGSTAGLCQPVERDLYDCYVTCFWPIHVPDLLNHAPDWTNKCAAAQQDWRKIDLIFP